MWPGEVEQRAIADTIVTDCEQIRAIINQQNHLGTKGVKAPEIDKVAIEPLGMDRDKQRIWALDSQFHFFLIRLQSVHLRLFVLTRRLWTAIPIR